MDEPDSYISFLSFLFQFKGLSVDLFNSTGLYSILAILVLLVCSGLISASEVAFFSLEPAEITEFRNDRESKLAKVIVYLTDKNQRLLATILIANNLVNVGIIIISSITSSFGHRGGVSGYSRSSARMMSSDSACGTTNKKHINSITVYFIYRLN